MKKIAIDLEMNQPSGKIIAIGAVVFNSRTAQIFGRYHQWINPEEPLYPEIQELCNVDVDLATMPTMPEAYAGFSAWVNEHQPHKMAVEWGAGVSKGGDCATLKKQIPEGAEWCLGTRSTDLKVLVQAIWESQGEPIKNGLKASMARFGLKFEGTEHRADDDAFNTGLFYCHFQTLFQNLYKLIEAAKKI